jgi:hypothetical protein
VLEQENDVDVSEASQSGTLDADGDGNGEVMSMGDLDVVVPPGVSGEDSVKSDTATI